MKKVITYGTFDVFHQGHYNLLKNARSLGDYLIVGVTTDSYDKQRGKLNVTDSLMERIESVKRSGFADKIIIEEYEGQKIDDILKYGVDIFTVGSDWVGKFDYLSEYCKVTYLQRTRGISSTKIRDERASTIRLGMIGCGRIANRFVLESKYVSGISLEGVYNPNIESARDFVLKHELSFYTDNLDEFIDSVDAVYIASPHTTHVGYIKTLLDNGKDVLCEKPMVLQREQAERLYQFAKKKRLVLMEAVKTAYCPGFNRMVSLAKSGAIGQIKDVEACFTKLVSGSPRELDSMKAGGSMTELASYVLLPIFKLLGTDFKTCMFGSHMDNGVDLFTKGYLSYDKAMASFKVGLGVKSEGELIISGTRGYLYVPAPWWKTDYFELRYEDLNQTRKFFYKFDGDGLRYELSEFVERIKSNEKTSYKLSPQESAAFAGVIENFMSGKDVILIG